MNKSTTQDAQNDNQISKTIRRFFTRFHISSALKSVNAYKSKGVLVKLFGNTLFGNHALYRNSIGVI